MLFGSICSSVQLGISLDQTALASALERHCANSLRKPLGMFLIVGTYFSWIVGKLGRSLVFSEACDCCCPICVLFGVWLPLRSLFICSSHRALGRHLGCVPLYLL